MSFAKKSIQSTIAFLLVFLFIFTPSLFAQDRGLDVVAKELGGQYGKIGKQYAVFIAIDKYRNWHALKNPVKDAMEIRDILKERYYVDTVSELYDGDATKAGIFKLLSSLVEDTRPEDSVFIYYAGHGQLDSMTDTGFWIPVDAGTDRFEQENWIPNIQIRNLVAKMGARHVALVSDSCFSGDILNPNRGESREIDGEYFKKAYERVARQVLTSGASEAVPDKSEFSAQLKLALRGNYKPYLDPLMLYAEVRSGMIKTTPLFGDLKESGHQAGGSFLFFLKNAAAQSTIASSQAAYSQPPEPVKAPSLVVTKSYGSASIAVRTKGDLYLGGKYIGTLDPGNAAELKDLEVGTAELEMRYSDGKRESKRADIPRNATVQVSFTYTERPPVPENMVYVQGGTFTMGSPSSEAERGDDETQHTVTLSDFMIGKYEVTQREYRSIMDTNPSYFKRDNLPVEQVSWYDAVEYCNARSVKEGLSACYTISGTNVTYDFSKNGYRLPTEAEWEYACRAGTTTATAYGNSLSSSQANFNGNYPYAGAAKGVYLEKTQAVGSYAPNGWGIYDMHGNVYEWCWDWYGNYEGGSLMDPKGARDPKGASSGSYRVLRGGSWDFFGKNLRSAFRSYLEANFRSSNYGFRVVRGVSAR